jgi:hypothetical protein
MKENLSKDLMRHIDSYLNAREFNIKKGLIYEVPYFMIYIEYVNGDDIDSFIIRRNKITNKQTKDYSLTMKMKFYSADCYSGIVLENGKEYIKLSFPISLFKEDIELNKYIRSLPKYTYFNGYLEDVVTPTELFDEDLYMSIGDIIKNEEGK